MGQGVQVWHLAGAEVARRAGGLPARWLARGAGATGGEAIPLTYPPVGLAGNESPALLAPGSTAPGRASGLALSVGAASGGVGGPVGFAGVVEEADGVDLVPALDGHRRLRGRHLFS